MSVDANYIFDAKSAETKDKLAELSAGLIDGIFATSLSAKLKNQDFSGDPTSGSIKVDRFINAKDESYGTAREAQKGNALRNAGKVIVAIDQDREVMEELALKDLRMFGLNNLADRRAENIRKRVVAVLDKAFFTELESKASEVTLTSYTTIQDKVEAMIATALSLKNDYIDGQDKEDLVLTLSVKAYGQLRNYIDKVTVPTVDNGTREINVYHGVEVHEAVRQTADIVISRKGAVAQPAHVDDYDLEKIPFANAFALQSFFSYGTKAVMPDTIFKGTL